MGEPIKRDHEAGSDLMRSLPGHAAAVCSLVHKFGRRDGGRL